MNESEKERLIKKDIESVENRVRHAFNQGFEMGLKESRSENPNTCGDAISIQLCRELNISPYPMIYDKEHCDPIYRKLQRWCNNFIFWRVPTFEEYIKGKGAKMEVEDAD